jgi:hypothetical protein
MYEDAVGVHPEHNVIIIRVLSDIQLVLRTLTNYMFATVKMRLNEDYKINQLALHLNSNTREVNKKKKKRSIRIIAEGVRFMQRLPV